MHVSLFFLNLTLSFITNAGNIADSNRVVKCGETNRHPCTKLN